MKGTLLKRTENEIWIKIMNMNINGFFKWLLFPSQHVSANKNILDKWFFWWSKTITKYLATLLTRPRLRLHDTVFKQTNWLLNKTNKQNAQCWCSVIPPSHSSRSRGGGALGARTHKDFAKNQDVPFHVQKVALFLNERVPLKGCALKFEMLPIAQLLLSICMLLFAL